MSVWLWVLSAIAAAVYAAAMQQDLTRRKIPNSLPIAIGVVAAAKWAILGQPAPAVWAVLAALAVFLVTSVMFWRGWMGGGDVKLLTATSFLLGAPATYPFILCTAVAGGFIALIVLAMSAIDRARFGRRPLGPETDPAVLARPSVTVPYGVAISIGALWVMFQQFTLR